jgi:hypothetical protein
LGRTPKKSRSGHHVSVAELLALIPQEFIDELAQSLAVDKWVKKLKADYLFKLVLFSLLSSERLSLRLMEDNFDDPLFQALAPALQADEVTWVSIRDRLMNVNSEFFRRLYELVYQRAEELYGDDRLHGYHIKRYDSTMIATFSHLLQGMKVGNTKRGKTQVKLTTELRGDFLIRMQYYDDQAYLSEERALREVIEQQSPDDQSIHVFDKGLKSRNAFEEFDADGVFFVTRLSEQPRYELLHPHWQDDGMQDSDELEFVQDSIVQLYHSGNQLTQRHFRLIQYQIKGQDKPLFFVTNVRELEAGQIASIYRSRWDIEVLFRFLKQEMNLTHFVCNDPNAIEVMLYCSMIVSMLILIYKKNNEIPSYKKAKIQFFKELMYSIFLEAMDQPEEMARLKDNFKRLIQRE